MDKEKRTEQRVMETLQRLKTLEDIDAPPFLQARLQTQIQEYEANKARPTFLRFHMKDLRPALLLVLLVFNILSVVFTIHFHADRREGSLAAFAEEYILTQDIGGFGF